MLMVKAPTELRKDPISDRWVLIRNTAPASNDNGTCPFCPGGETRTPPEIAAYRVNGDPPNSPRWLIRVIPETLPLLQVEGNVRREGLGMYDWVSGRGASEIVIETPDHHGRWDRMPLEHVRRILAMYRERMEDLYRDPQIRILLVSRKEPTAGAHGSHPVSRIVGAPVLFDDMRTELLASRTHFSRKGRCLFCDVLGQERREGLRVIEETSHFLAYAPYASTRPFEAIVIPTAHTHRFEQVLPEALTDLAGVVQRTIRRFHTVLPDRAVTFAIHTAPNEALRANDEDWQALSEHYHWHIEMAPDEQVEKVGGTTVNVVPPEEAAARLREVAG